MLAAGDRKLAVGLPTAVQLYHFSTFYKMWYNKIRLGVRTQRAEGIVVLFVFSSRVLIFLHIYLSACAYCWHLAVMI